MVPALQDYSEELDDDTSHDRDNTKSLPDHARRRRQVVPGLFLLAGYRFHLFYTRIVAGAAATGRRPPAVEAFLPISALMSLKYFLLTGNYDEIHPAGLTILIAALVSAFLARKVLCSWVCPVGGISRALEWVGEKTIWKRRKKEALLPVWADQALSAIKYLLLAFFLYAVVLMMDATAIMKFQRGTYNYAADAKMLLFFTEMTGVTAVTLAILALLSIVVKNFWCRYLCPYGALLGLVCWFSPQRVVRDSIDVHRLQGVHPGVPGGDPRPRETVRVDPRMHRLHVVRGGVPGGGLPHGDAPGKGGLVAVSHPAGRPRHDLPVLGRRPRHRPLAQPRSRDQLAEAYRQAKDLLHP